MHTLVSHTCIPYCLRNTCVAAKGVMRFSCVASAAHFLFCKRGKDKMRKISIAVLLFLLLTICLCSVGCDKCMHSYKKATCSEPKTCRWCGETNGEPLAHTWQEATCTTPKTCTVCSITEGNMAPHTWLKATCTQPQTCTVCGKTEGKVLAHNWIAASCSAPKTCKTCGSTVGDPLAHILAPATCVKPATCYICKAEQGEPLGHSATEATCTEDSICSKCNTVVKKALGHNWADATCTSPQICTRCNIRSGSSLGHNYQGAFCRRCNKSNPKFLTCSQIEDNIYVKVLGVPQNAVAIENISYQISGSRLNLTLDGQKTFDILGKNHNAQSQFIWKLYDAGGYIVDTGTVVTEALVKGDRFQIHLTIKDIDLTDTYSIKFYSYELLD